jgi:hypothetical protein
MGAGAFLALGFFEGAIYPMAQTAVFLAMLMATLAAVRRDPWPLISLGGVALFSVGFAAIKLMPSYSLCLRYSRPTSPGDGFPLRAAMTALFSRNQSPSRDVAPQLYLFECGAYLGPAFTILASIGALTSRHRSWLWVFLALAILVLAMGNFAPYSPWALLHQLPVISWQRVTSRFLVLLVMCISVLAGCGVEFLTSSIQPIGMITAILLLGAGTIDAWRVG